MIRQQPLLCRHHFGDSLLHIHYLPPRWDCPLKALLGLPLGPQDFRRMQPQGCCPELTSMLQSISGAPQLAGRPVRCSGSHRGSSGCGRDSVRVPAENRPGQRALPALHCCGSQRTLHSLLLPWWGAPAVLALASLDNSLRGRALLSHPSPRKLAALTLLHKGVQAQPRPHSSCATWRWPAGANQGISLQPHPGRVSVHMHPTLREWWPGAPRPWRGLCWPPNVLLGSGILGNKCHGHPGPTRASSNSKPTSQQGRFPQLGPCGTSHQASRSHWGPGGGDLEAGPPRCLAGAQGDSGEGLVPLWLLFLHT